MVVATETTALLEQQQNGGLEGEHQEEEEHYMSDMFPNFVVSSVEAVEEAVEQVVEHLGEVASEVAEQIGEVAVDLTTFETLQVEGPVPLQIFEEDYDTQKNTEEEYPEAVLPADPLAPFDSPEKLGVIPLAVMIFYGVSGGPFGVEASVRFGGNFFTLLGFLVMPFIWSMQEALVTAELATTFPEASGGVAWVEEAFGSNAGWMAGYLGWLAGATDNAIYPVLFLEYFLQILAPDGSEMDPVLRFFVLSCASIALGYVNWLGLPLVGKMSITICCIAMSPFVIMTVVGIVKVDPNRWFELPQEDPATFEDFSDKIAGGFFPQASLCGVFLRPFLNNLFWNLNSFDAAASFAAEVDDPGRVIPKAMKWSVVLVVCCYFFPLLIAIGATDAKQHEWVDGFLASVTSEVAGPWLGAWTVFAAGISNIALFQAELSADAFQLMGMADRGHVPKLFSIRSKHGTPTYGIVLGIAVIVVMGTSDLSTLIEILNFNYALSLLMEYCAFIKLRISEPDLERPFRIPLSTTGCIIMLIPTFVFVFIVLALATYQTYMFILVCNVVGVLVYKARERSEAIYQAMQEKDVTLLSPRPYVSPMQRARKLHHQ
jgi:amino acid transporter